MNESRRKLLMAAASFPLALSVTAESVEAKPRRKRKPLKRKAKRKPRTTSPSPASNWERAIRDGKNLEQPAFVISEADRAQLLQSFTNDDLVAENRRRLLEVYSAEELTAEMMRRGIASAHTAMLKLLTNG